jgi:2'-5' RNA ligase
MKYVNYLSEGKDPKEWRGCLMLSFPEEISNAIQAWGKSKISDDVLTDSGRETYTHCTILYGFSQVTRFSDVQAYLENSLGLTDKKKLKVTLGEVKRFSCPDYDVIHIAVENCMPLYEMHFALKDKFHVKTSYATYNPHATIAYVKKGACAELDGVKLFAGLEIACDQITYSTGPSEERTRTEINYESFKERLRPSKAIPL